MEPKSINVGGINLAYYLQHDEQPYTIFFVHGNSVSSLSWKKQFSDPRLSAYRLVALDLPAHGLSEASPDPERDYSLPGLARIIADALPLLVTSDRYLLVGLSLGANLVAETLALGLRPAGIVLAGPSVLGAAYPVSKVVKPGTHVYTVFTDTAPETDVVAYSKEGILSEDPADRDAFLFDYQRVRKPFRSVFNQSLENKYYSDEIQLLADSGIPQCVIMGADEQVVFPDYLDNAGLPLWRRGVYKIPGASHLVNVDRPDVFNELLAAFAEDVFR